MKKTKEKIRSKIKAKKGLKEKIFDFFKKIFNKI